MNVKRMTEKASNAAMDRIIFTLVELLVVVAVIAILISMLLPALRNARSMAKAIGCQNNQKNIGVAHFGYQGDWEGMLVPNFGVYCWEKSLAPFLGFQEGQSWYPKNSPGNVFTCPEQPQGNNNGNYPSFGRNFECGDHPGGGYDKTGRKITTFKRPSGKVFIADNPKNDAIMSTTQFVPREYDSTSGFITIRHMGKKCNISFLDGHVVSYGTPPIPRISRWQDGAPWMSPGYDPPAGL